MATWDDVRAAALSMPETTEGVSRGNAAWSVRDKFIAWERPLGKGEIKALGASALDGPIVGFRTPDLARKDELLAAHPGVLFTTPHFDGYPAVLARLELLERELLERLILEAWLDRAPKKLRRSWLEREGPP